MYNNIYNKYLKRIIDLVCSSVLIVILLPFFILISILILTDDFGTIIFSQKRVGKNKKIFKLYKFRTMKISTPHDTPTHLLKNPEKYITKVGKFLRKTSLDELPQLFNIVIGQMSFIGPRPALWNQDDLVAEREKYKANDIRPGLSGYAQINGRDELPIVVKAQLDGEYVKNMSFLFDLQCLLKTFQVVITHKGLKEGS